MKPFKEGDPLENWQSRYPLPESLENPLFKFWFVHLAGEHQKRVGDDVARWYENWIRTGVTPIDLQTQRSIDQLLGASVNMKIGSTWFSKLSNKHLGSLRRISIEENVKRDDVSS